MLTELPPLKEIVGTRSHTIDEIYRRISALSESASIILFGEATHGTHEFYSLRAALTQRLIIEKGFNAVAVEADWPDAYRVNRYVRGIGSDRNANEALGDFKRFPAWMWRNEDVRKFIEWLEAFNRTRASRDAAIGFYGVDLYSLSASVHAVLKYLAQVDPAAAKRAKERYSCFEMFLEDPQAYGYAATLGLTEDCEREALRQLIELRRNAPGYLSRDGMAAQDEQFSAERNAQIVTNAESYYRAMFAGNKNTWSLRDTHMFETIRSLLNHLRRSRDDAKIIVWEHNSHIGDARATELGRSKELNVGQLIRQEYGGRSYLIGFTTYSGTVTAASDWDGDAETKRVRPALEGSYEALFHEVGVPEFLLTFEPGSRTAEILSEARLERAIGVIYRPETERQSHYFKAHLPSQFDAVIHVDTTTAVKPLMHEIPSLDEMPETYPTGL